MKTRAILIRLFFLPLLSVFLLPETLYAQGQTARPFQGNDEWGRPQAWVDKDGDGSLDTARTYDYDGTPRSEVQWGGPGTGQFRVRLYDRDGGYTEYIDTDGNDIMDKKITVDSEGNRTEEPAETMVFVDAGLQSYDIYTNFDRQGRPHTRESYDKDGSLRERTTWDEAGNPTTETWDTNGNPAEPGSWLPARDWRERAREEFKRGTGIDGSPSPYGGGGADYEWITGEDGIPSPVRLSGVPQITPKSAMDAGEKTTVQTAQATVVVKEEKEPKESKTTLPCQTANSLVRDGLLDMEVTGTGTTTGLVSKLTNKTNEHLCVIIPTGTLVTTTSKGYQPYQTGRIPPIVLEPGETLVKEFPAYCTDNSLEPAPTGASVKYALQTGPLNEQCQKLAELIAVTQGMRDLYENCGDEAEPDDVSLEPYWGKRFYQSWMGTEAPQKAPQYGPDELLELLRRIEKEGWYALIPKASEPEDWGKRLAPSWMGAEAVKPFSIGPFELQSPLSLPGTLQFGLKEGVPELRLALSYTENGEEQTGSLVATKPRGSVEVSVETTDDPEIVRFNMNKIRAYSPSVTFDDRDRGDIMLTLNSPEKSTGILNIKTGEVIGTASLKALGEKYKEPFPAAVSYRGKLNFATRELNLEVSGTSFEPVKLKERGLYQRTQSEKFWDSVQLYTIWDETNDAGQKELRKVMTEQLKTEFPEGRAEELAGMVTTEIMDKVDEVKDLHKGLKEEKFDFSKLDPTLKWRKT